MLVCWHALTVVFNTGTQSHNIEGSDIRGLVWHSLQTNICVRQAPQNVMSDILKIAMLCPFFQCNNANTLSIHSLMIMVRGKLFVC